MPFSRRAGRRRRPGPGRSSSWRGFLTRLGLLVAPFVVAAAVADSWSAVVAGRLTADPSWPHLTWFAVLLVVSMVASWVEALIWRRWTAIGEARLRGQILDAALHRPLPALEDDAVGGLLERVDSDPQSLLDAVQGIGAGIVGALVGAVAAWVTAGITWWPAWLLFPVAATAAWLVSKGRTGRIRAASEAAEEAWSTDSARFEEALAAADDLRTSAGQGFVLSRYARQAADTLRKQAAVRWAANVVGVRLAVVLAGFTGATVLAGMWAVDGGRLDVAKLVTLFLLVSSFAGQARTLLSSLPDVEEALGTLTRVRKLLVATPEPAGGRAMSPAGDGAPGVELAFRDLSFTYTTDQGDGFTLGPLTLTVPPGRTLALVGRTGSGKTTLTKLVSRAVEPPPGTVLLDGVDVRDLDLEQLRGQVGVVGQRTEILAGTLRENLSLYQPVGDDRLTAALGALGLSGWLASLPDGLDTVLGGHGRRLSAGEEQLVAFARLLVRDVRVIVLDEATARMDAHTARTVTLAARRLLAGRTGIVVAHRLATARHADQVAVMHDGRVVEHGPWEDLEATGGRLARLVASDGGRAEPGDVGVVDAEPGDNGRDRPDPSEEPGAEPARRDDEPAPPAAPSATADGQATADRARGAGGWGPFARLVARTMLARPRWWVVAETAWWLPDMIGTGGVLMAAVWAYVVTGLTDGVAHWHAAAVFVTAGLLVPFLRLVATRPGNYWWSESYQRIRMTILRGQLDHSAGARAQRGTSGETTGRAAEAGRLTFYANQARYLFIELLNVAILVAITRSAIAAGIGAAVVAGCAATSWIGKRMIRTTAARARETRAVFARDLASILDAARTVKLAGATRAALTHLRARDRDRVDAGVRESWATFLIGQARTVLAQAATVAVWALHVTGAWPLSTTLIVIAAMGTYTALGWQVANLLTRAAPTRDWTDDAQRMAGTADVSAIPADTDLVGGTHDPAPLTRTVPPLRTLQLTDVRAVHADGTTGVHGVNLTARAGQTIALVGAIGSGKSSLLAGLAGLARLEGRVAWNGAPVTDLARLAGSGISYVAQIPRIVSGTVTENVHLDHSGRDVANALRVARMDDDVAAAGGPDALVGHRGLRLSGGQTQRLALARALAAGADLLVLDDVSSALDAATEEELWRELARTPTTIIAATSRHATLARADHVVVLHQGRQAAVGPWHQLRHRWGHLAG